jgi:hypothetical protein
MKSKLLSKIINGLIALLSKIKYCKSSCCESECMTKSEESTDTSHIVT